MFKYKTNSIAIIVLHMSLSLLMQRFPRRFQLEARKISEGIKDEGIKMASSFILSLVTSLG